MKHLQLILSLTSLALLAFCYNDVTVFARNLIDNYIKNNESVLLLAISTVSALLLSIISSPYINSVNKVSEIQNSKVNADSQEEASDVIKNDYKSDAPTKAEEEPLESEVNDKVRTTREIRIDGVMEELNSLCDTTIKYSTEDYAVLITTIATKHNMKKVGVIMLINKVFQIEIKENNYVLTKK